MTKILVVTYEQYAPRKTGNPKEKIIKFYMFDSALGIIHLSVHHRTADKYIFKVKAFISQKFLSPQLYKQTSEVEKFKICTMTDILKYIITTVLLFFCVCVCGGGGCIDIV
jgi:hypothetical protein